MIIDLILDRYNINGDKCGTFYHASKFYKNVLEYENTLQLDHDITVAMDYGTDADIKKALCNYVINNGYNPAICDRVNAVTWLTDDGGAYEPVYDITDDNGKMIFNAGRMYAAYSIDNNGGYTFKINNKLYYFTACNMADYFIAK